MKTYGKVKGKLHAFLTSTTDEAQWLTLRFSRFTPEKEPGEEKNLSLG
jgi:hypothetical protein